MKLLWLYLMAFLILPIIGEYVIWFTGMHVSAGLVTFDLIVHNIIFVVVLLLITYMVQNYKTTKSNIVEMYDYKYIKKVFKTSIVLLTISSLIIFLLGGYKILLGIADRGEVRITLGLFGPLYTLVLTYLPTVILVYSSVVYIHVNKKIQKKLKLKLVLIYSFAILIGILSGYKAVAVSLMIPGFVVLYFKNFNIFRVLFFSIIVIIILTLFTALVRGIDINSGFSFLIYRATTMTAYGTIGVWNVFPDGVSLSDGFINFLGAFGANISSSILGLSTNDPEFLKTNLSRLITYEVYPNKEGALSGSVNVTVTNFGHAIYLFGRTFYVVYAFIMGVIIGLVIRAYKKYIIKGYPLKASLTALYFFSAIIPSINSGGIFILFSLPVLVYFILSYFIVKLFLKGKIHVI